tara:strand:- start:553 stop:921 length:369 start_codon:yes stop_codon:yes gene_type:complete
MTRKITVTNINDAPARKFQEGVISRRMVTLPKDDSDRFMLSIMTVAPGTKMPEGAYDDKDEAIYVIKGQFKLTFKNETITLNPGDALFIPMGEASSMENPGSETTELLAVIAPSKNSEELEL